MARKSTFSGGGGILNNSDGVIQDIQFTTETPFANEGGYLYAAVTINEDSRETPTTQFLFAGGTEEEFEITKDARGVTPATPGRKLGRGTAFADFIGSIDATDHPGTLGDDEDVLDYSPVIGTRGRFMQQPLDATELGKLKARGKATVRKDKNDPSKSYPLTKTVMSTFYGMEAVQAVKPVAAPVKTAGRNVADVRAQLAARRKTA